MSKPVITFKIDEYICSALDSIRTMDKTHDYSGLMAVVERIQIHANNMENGLRYYNDGFWDMNKVLDNKKLTKDEKLDKISEVVKKKLKVEK